MVPHPFRGYPSPSWGVPQNRGTTDHNRTGALSPPPTGTPTRTGYTWTGYATGGTPLAVSRMRTVFFVLVVMLPSRRHRRQTAVFVTVSSAAGR